MRFFAAGIFEILSINLNQSVIGGPLPDEFRPCFLGGLGISLHHLDTGTVEGATGQGQAPIGYAAIAE